MGTASLPLQPRPLCCFHCPFPLSLAVQADHTFKLVFSASLPSSIKAPWVLGLAPWKGPDFTWSNNSSCPGLGWAGAQPWVKGFMDEKLGAWGTNHQFPQLMRVGVTRPRRSRLDWEPQR